MPTYNHDWLCQRIVEGTNDAIIFGDRAGVIRLWNTGAEILFGYTAEEMVGQSMDPFIPERQRERHWEGWHRVMQTGVTKYGRELLAVPAIRKDGARISLEFSILLVRDEAGEMLGAVAIMREVTARWQRDRELKQRLAELEAKVKSLEKTD